MAENFEVFKLSNFQSSLEYFELYIQDVISKLLENTAGENDCSFSDARSIQSKLNICSFRGLNRHRNRPNSDLIVRTDLLHGRLKSQEINELHNGICRCPEIETYTSSSCLDQHNNIHIVLDRKKFTKDLIQMVVDQGMNYGWRQESKPEDCVLINCCYFNTMHDELTVQQLRGVLLSHHLAEVLKQNGWKVHLCSKAFENVQLEPFGISNLSTVREEDACWKGTARSTKVIHVCGQEKYVFQQKVAFSWKYLAHSENMVTQNQKFFCYAGAVLASNSKVSAPVQELLRIRTKQVKHSYITKYGASVNDESWRETINKMAISVIKMEILLVQPNSPIKLDLMESDDYPSICRQALFVLYNCARLAKILEKYNKQVESGIYPALPDANDVDFSHLKEPIEWDLVIKYLANYPVIVRNLATSVNTSSLLIKFTSNKTAQFLVSLSQDISSYYSRVHILGEAREHLYPAMFARIYLVKSLHQVMKNAMKLLNIEAISQM